MKTKEKKVIDSIRQTFEHPDIQNNPELKRILQMSVKDINANQPYQLISIKLSKNISNYLLSHQFSAPKVLLDLKKTLETPAESYRGIPSVTSWFSNLF